MYSEEGSIQSLTVGTLQLCGCSGCHIALLDVGTDLFDLIDKGRIEIKCMQILMDTKAVEHEVDLLLVEGCVLTEHDESMLKHYSRWARKIVAVGSCACLGGPAALANQYHREDVLRKMYSNRSGRSEVPNRDLPSVHEFACPIDVFVRVDSFIPGCPPEARILRNFLGAAVRGDDSSNPVNTVCDECTRKRNGESPTEIKRIIEIEELNSEKCLVEQGLVCMGKMTMGGCGAKCPSAGAPCEGCRGPSHAFRDVSSIDASILSNTMKMRGFDKDSYC